MLNFVGLLRSKDFLFPAFETETVHNVFFCEFGWPSTKSLLFTSYLHTIQNNTHMYYYNLYLSDTDDEEVIVDDQTRSNDIYSARNAESTGHLAYENHTWERTTLMISSTCAFGPDHLESTILKITGKISLVIKSLLFRKIVNFLLVICQSNMQKINYFLT